jgi:hypothetical protein
MERGCAPAQVEQHPTQVDGTANLPRSVELDVPVGRIGHQDATAAQGQQLHGPVAHGACEHEPKQQTQDDDVAKGITDRNDLLEQRHAMSADVRLDEKDPREQGARHGDDQRVQ